MLPINHDSLIYSIILRNSILKIRWNSRFNTSCTSSYNSPSHKGDKSSTLSSNGNLDFYPHNLYTKKVPWTRGKWYENDKQVLMIMIMIMIMIMMMMMVILIVIIIQILMLILIIDY